MSRPDPTRPGQAATVPPEVPPYRRPMPPLTPVPPSPPPSPAPPPVLPTWYEPDPAWADRAVLDQLLARRTVLAVGRLDPAAAARVGAQLLLLGGSAGEEITLHLSATDGDLDACLALADTIETLAAPVRALAVGTVGGAAVGVLAAAAQREASPHATIVLSLPPAAAEGSASRIAVQAELVQRQVGRLRDLVARATGRPAEDVEPDLRTGRVLTAEEAVHYGVLHRVR